MAIAPGVRAVGVYRTGWNPHQPENDTFMIMIDGLPQTQLAISDHAPSLRFGRVDSCSIARFSNTGNYPYTQLGDGFYFYRDRAPDDNTYSWASLPVDTVPLRRNGVLYLPE